MVWYIAAFNKISDFPTTTLRFNSSTSTDAHWLLDEYTVTLFCVIRRMLRPSIHDGLDCISISLNSRDSAVGKIFEPQMLKHFVRLENLQSGSDLKDALSHDHARRFPKKRCFPRARRACPIPICRNYASQVPRDRERHFDNSDKKGNI